MTFHQLLYGLIISITLGWGNGLLYGQVPMDTPVSQETTRLTVRQLLDRLEATKQFRLAYSESYLDVRQAVRLPNKTPTVKELLDAISRATNTTYQVQGNQVIFRKKGAKFTISGYLRDAASGEDLIGASVWDAGSQSGTSSNDYGFYSLTLPAGDTVRLRSSYVGHVAQDRWFVLSQDTLVDWNLADQSLDEVVVAATGNSLNRPTFDLPLPLGTLESLPTLLGEVDVLKSLQRLPGVQAGNDGGAGLYVRGSGPDQNLILLDGVPVYNASHLFGFFSVFNADAVNNVQFFKGGFPARYGGRLSSVVDIQLKEGNRKEFHGAGSVGLLSTKLTLEGPIIPEKTSFLVSARRTYLDVVTQTIERLSEDAEIPSYWFSDLTAKINHRLSRRDQLYLGVYAGRDRSPGRTLSIPDSSEFISYYGRSAQDLRWGNTTTALRWNHVYHPKLFSNVTLTYSQYRFRLQDDELTVRRNNQRTVIDRSSVRRQSGITDGGVKVDYDYLPSPRHYVRFGAGLIRHAFRPGTTRYLSSGSQEAPTDTTIRLPTVRAIEAEAFIEDDVQLSNKVTMNGGIRATNFRVESASSSAWQPRVTLRYQPSGYTNWQASYSRMTQFVHLLTNPSTALPSDLWLPATRRVPPETAQQWTVGYQRTFRHSYALQAEAYYKSLQNVVEYKEGSLSLYEEVVDDWQERIASGRGYSYGAELLAQKSEGRLTGWLGYSWLRSCRQFDEINDGRWFPFKYDRRHDIDLGGLFHWKEHIDISLGWGYATGFAVTLPTVLFSAKAPSSGVRYDIPDNEYLVYGERNSQRTRATHRLDLSISFCKQKRWGERIWEVSLYNVYSRKNPFYTYLARQPSYPGPKIYRFRQVSLLPILPSVSYRFKF